MSTDCEVNALTTAPSRRLNDFLNYSLKMGHPVNNAKTKFIILVELSISFKSYIFPIDFTKGNLMVGQL